MIRPATPEDAAEIARLGRQFFNEAEWADVASYDEADCAASVAGLIASDDGIVLVVDCEGIVGMAAGVMSPLYFNLAHRTGQELFWWMHPDHRRGWGRKLLDALEHAARDAGCASWVMVCLDKVEPARTGRIYERRGYRASEHSYIKAL